MTGFFPIFDAISLQTGTLLNLSSTCCQLTYTEQKYKRTHLTYGFSREFVIKICEIYTCLVQKATNLSCSGKSLGVSRILSILQPEYKIV